MDGLEGVIWFIVGVFGIGLAVLIFGAGVLVGASVF